MLLDPPAILPVGLTHLSASSARTFLRDPEKWRRRYVEVEYEPSSGSLIVGSAVHAAEHQNYAQKAQSGRDLLVSDVLDAYSDEFDYARDVAEAGVDWNGDRPGRVKDTGARVLGLYHRTVAPRVRPVASERRFEIAIPHVEWTFVGYRDIVEEHGIGDLKARGVGAGIVRPEEAAADLEATAYLWADRYQRASQLTRFAFHNLVQRRRPRPADVVVTPTTRTPEQLDTFLALLYRVAAEMAWRVENDVWVGARPGDPLCSERYCGYFARCAFGGAHRPREIYAPRPIRRPQSVQAMAAVEATLRKDGTTTAARVASHLGVSVRSASGYLRGLEARGEVAGKEKKRKGSRPHRVYAVTVPIEEQLEASLRRIT
jgi:hypothetical protein